uniref:DUF4283 domain-containing protein n=1 Tax=Cannabis sativa TaxID=3483 RepID=A0A803PSL9_CANSA
MKCKSQKVELKFPKNLTQVEEEDFEGVTVGGDGVEEGIDDRWCLVGRFLSNRMIDFDKMRNILASLWQPGMEMFVKKLENNRFLFQFYHEIDIQRVINGSPWTYERMQLIIQRLPVGGDPYDVRLNNLDIWVQIHDVKLGCMTEGTVCGVDQITKPYGDFMGVLPQKNHKNIGAQWLCVPKGGSRRWLTATMNLDISLEYEGCFVVEANGRSGGLVLFWKNEEEVNVDSFFTNHIDSLIQFEGYGKFRFTGLYGEPNRSLRRNTWQLLWTLYARSKEAWCIMGYFNNVLHNSEKIGGNPYSTWLIEGFKEVTQQCGLIDLEMNGHPFTWEKSKDTPQWIEAKLDRTMVNHDWLIKFPDAKLFNTEVSPSDHSPLFLDMEHRVAVERGNFSARIKNCNRELASIKNCNRELKQLKSRRDAEGKQQYVDTNQ